jgi:hypothetical protein
MRKVTAIFLTALFTLPIWVKVAVLLEFVVNRAYIVEHYCENRDKPQLRCEGKCYLAKQLKKAEHSPSDANRYPIDLGVQKWEFSEFDFRDFMPGFFWRLVPQPKLTWPYRGSTFRGFPRLPERPPNT